LENHPKIRKIYLNSPDVAKEIIEASLELTRDERLD
jgi:hypothetical protein